MEERVVIALVINFFLLTLRSSTGCFKDAAGIYYEDRHVPFIELTVNIFFSVALSKTCGLTGIFVGTVISNFVIHLYSFPKFVVTTVIGQSYKEYFVNFIKKNIVFLFVLIISSLFKKIILFDSVLLNLVLSMFFSIVIPNLFLFLLYRNKEEFSYFKSLVKGRIKF